eukprot:453707-Pleurochrysis_carterae.AAC.1
MAKRRLGQSIVMQQVKSLINLISVVRTGRPTYGPLSAVVRINLVPSTRPGALTVCCLQAASMLFWQLDPGIK